MGLRAISKPVGPRIEAMFPEVDELHTARANRWYPLKIWESGRLAPERPKIRYARFWRAAYLRRADCELRQAAFRGEVREPFAEVGAESRAHDCVRIGSGLLAYYSRQSCTDARR
jgi:hypothetical protein